MQIREAIQQVHERAETPRVDFAASASAVFGRIHHAMTRLVDVSPGPIRRAVDLQKALNVDAPLAWRVFKIATAEDPLEAVDYTLTPGQINTLIDAARKKRVPSEVTTEIRAAIDGYSNLLHEHAGNRESLNMMVASLRPDKSNLIDEKCRKITFQQNSLIWGQQQDLLLGCFIVIPDKKTGVTNSAMVMGHLGFHGVRPGIGHELTLQAKISAEKNPMSPPPNESVGTYVESELLREFCSPDLSAHVTTNNEHFTKVQVRLPGLGRQAAVDYYQLFTSRQISDASNITLNGMIYRPTAMLHQDILVPAHDPPSVVHARVFGKVDDFGAFDQLNAGNILPIDIAANYIGTGVDILPAPGVPRYGEIVRSVLERFGWYGMRFDIYRCRLAYPVLHTIVHLNVGQQLL